MHNSVLICRWSRRIVNMDVCGTPRVGTDGGQGSEMQLKLAVRLILTWQSYSEKFILAHELLLGDGEERWWVTLPVFLSMSSFLQLSYHQTTRQQQEPPRIPGIKSRDSLLVFDKLKLHAANDAAEICAAIGRHRTVACFSRQVSHEQSWRWRIALLEIYFGGGAGYNVLPW